MILSPPPLTGLGYLGNQRLLSIFTIKPFPFQECFTLLLGNQIEESLASGIF
jgi:hypothetical protein